MPAPMIATVSAPPPFMVLFPLWSATLAESSRQDHAARLSALDQFHSNREEDLLILGCGVEENGGCQTNIRFSSPQWLSRSLFFYLLDTKSSLVRSDIGNL